MATGERSGVVTMHVEIERRCRARPGAKPVDGTFAAEIVSNMSLGAAGFRLVHPVVRRLLQVGCR